MKRAALLLTLLLLPLLAVAQTTLPKTNRVLAAVDLTDPDNPKTEVVFINPSGVNFRAPLSEMTKHLQAGNRLMTIDEFNATFAQAKVEYDTLLKHDNEVVAKYNGLVEQYNHVASKKASQQQALAFWLATQQQNRPSPTQPMEDFLRRQQEKQDRQIHCTSDRVGDTTTTDCR